MHNNIVVKVGFLDNKGQLVGEGVRSFEVDGVGVSPKGFMSTLENFIMDKYNAEATQPGTSSY